MLLANLDAGASKAGMSILRAKTEERGTRFTCLRHGHLDLELDGGTREEAAVTALLALADAAHELREVGERLVFVVEGIEGFVYPGRSTTHLFDTADQAGGIRLCLRTWARLRGVRLDDVRDVRKTTAKQVRRVLFGKAGDSAGDNEVVIAVQACVGGMPPMPVPVPSSGSKAYTAMHAYDASAAGLAVAVDILGWKALRLPDAALVQLLQFRRESEETKAKKKAAKAEREWHVAAGTPSLVPRVDSRHTRRRRREAATAAARRTA
jgi:hypothetical protein